MILETIADANRVRYEEIEKQVPLEVIKQKALSMETDNEFPFEKALAGKDISFICEVKKASPSKGIIAEDFPYVQIAKDYENNIINDVTIQYQKNNVEVSKINTSLVGTYTVYYTAKNIHNGITHTRTITRTVIITN